MTYIPGCVGSEQAELLRRIVERIQDGTLGLVSTNVESVGAPNVRVSRFEIALVIEQRKEEPA